MYEKAELIDITQIITDGGTQLRVRLDEGTVEEYREALETAGEWVFPPVVVFGYEQLTHTFYWLADGFHRIEAARRAGFTDVPAEVREGGRREAILYAAEANTTHGLRQTRADRHNAVSMLLADSEWVTWSDREIARICGVSPTMVGSVRRDMQASGAIEAVDKRVYEREGQVQAMSTVQIGQLSEPEDKGPTLFDDIEEGGEELDLYYGDKLAEHFRQFDLAPMKGDVYTIVSQDKLAESPPWALNEQEDIETMDWREAVASIEGAYHGGYIALVLSRRNWCYYAFGESARDVIDALPKAVRISGEITLVSRLYIHDLVMELISRGHMVRIFSRESISSGPPIELDHLESPASAAAKMREDDEEDLIGKVLETYIKAMTDARETLATAIGYVTPEKRTILEALLNTHEFAAKATVGRARKLLDQPGIVRQAMRFIQTAVSMEGLQNAHELLQNAKADNPLMDAPIEAVWAAWWEKKHELDRKKEVA